MAKTAFHVAQIIGSRKRQEDDFGVVWDEDEKAVRLLVVADGMGGHAGGDIASRLATQGFIEAFGRADPQRPAPERLRAAALAANTALLDRMEAEPALEGMGTTIVAIAREPDGYYYLSIGDSLLFVLGRNGLRRVNADHSMRSVLLKQVEKGELRAEAVDRHPQRNQLLSALGDEELELVDCPDAPIALAKGDLLVVASDGIETLPEERIAAILREHAGSSKKAVDALLAAVEAEARPKQDNCTVAVWSPTMQAGGARVGAASKGLPRQLAVVAVVALVAAIGAALLWFYGGGRLKPWETDYFDYAEDLGPEDVGRHEPLTGVDEPASDPADSLTPPGTLQPDASGTASPGPALATATPPAKTPQVPAATPTKAPNVDKSGTTAQPPAPPAQPDAKAPEPEPEPGAAPAPKADGQTQG